LVSDSPFKDVRSQAVAAIGRFFKEREETLFWLKHLIQHNEHPEVRKAAFGKIVENWCEKPGMLIFLLTYYLDDATFWPEKLQTSTRIEAFQKFLQNEDITEAQRLEMLQDRAQNDSDQQLRGWAVEPKLQSEGP